MGGVGYRESFRLYLVHWSCLPTPQRTVRVPPGAPFALLEDAMSERQVDSKTRSLITQIDEYLRDAERLRHHVAAPQPRIWPDQRRASRVPEGPGKKVHDEEDGAQSYGRASPPTVAG